MPRWMCGWGCTAAKLSSASRGSVFLTFQHTSLTSQSIRTFTQLKCCVELVLLLNSSNMKPQQHLQANFARHCGTCKRVCELC